MTESPKDRSVRRLANTTHGVMLFVIGAVVIVTLVAAVCVLYVNV